MLKENPPQDPYLVGRSIVELILQMRANTNTHTIASHLAHRLPYFNSLTRKQLPCSNQVLVNALLQRSCYSDYTKTMFCGQASKKNQVLLELQLRQKKSGEALGSENWLIEIDSRLQNYESHYCLQTITEVAALLQALPLWQHCSTTAATRMQQKELTKQSRKYKKSLVIDYKVHTANTPCCPPFREEGCVSREFRPTPYAGSIRVSVFYSSAQILNKGITQIEQISRPTLAKKLKSTISTVESEKNLEAPSARLGRKLSSVYSFYDQEHDITILSSEASDFKDSPMSPCLIILEDEAHSSSDYECILNQKDEKLEQFITNIRSIKSDLLQTDE